MKVKFSIRKKLLFFIIPIIVLSFLMVVYISYSSSKSSIQSKTQALLKAEAKASANSIETWQQKNLAILNTAVSSMVKNKMDKKAILEYENMFLGTYDAFPNGIYIVQDNGEVIDASGWVPDSDPRENDYYKEGVNFPGEMTFLDAYIDDLTKEFVVTATRYEADINNGAGGVVCADISLNVLSEVISNMKIEGNGDTMIVDVEHGTILAHSNDDLLGKNVSEVGDSFYNELDNFLKSNESTYKSISSQDGRYMVNYDVIDGTNWAVVVRSLESNIFKDVKKLGFMLSFMGIFVIALITIVIFIIINKITKPIHQITNAITKVSAGDFTVDIPIKGSDEISLIARKLNQFMTTMRGTISTIVSISDKIDSKASESNGISSELHDSANSQATAMNEMLQNLDELVKSIATIAEDATTLAIVVQETDESGEHALNNINDTMTEADSGRNSMSKLTTDMATVCESMDILEQKITEVGNAAVKIDDITATIREIADQTNLLALNASIEAARAGEAGKGFSVVATEIKGLAETSGEAANEISELINSVTHLIDKTVEQSRNSVTQLHESENSIVVASNQFNHIYTSIANTSDIVYSMINRIHTANDVASSMAAITEEQSASAEEIDATACNVQELANLVTENSANVKSESDELSSTATSLKERIDGFIV